MIIELYKASSRANITSADHKILTDIEKKFYVTIVGQYVEYLGGVCSAVAKKLHIPIRSTYLNTNLIWEVINNDKVVLVIKLVFENNEARFYYKFWDGSRYNEGLVYDKGKLKGIIDLVRGL